MRHDVALVKLVGSLGLCEIGPVVRHVQEHAEVTLLLVQSLEHRDRVVRGADHAVLVLDEPLRRVLSRWRVEAWLVVVDVAEIPLEPELDVLVRLAARFGDVHRADQPQARRVHPAPLLGGEIAGDLPVRRERVVAERIGRGDADHAEVVLAGQPAARGRHRARHGHLGKRLGIGRDMRAGVDQGVPIGLLGDGLAAKQSQDHVERLLHAVALGERIDAEHEGVGGEQPRAGAEHDAPAGVVVELNDAVRHHERIVIGQRDHPRAEPDRARPFRGHRDEQLGRADQLPTRRMMLADPGLVITEPIEPLHQLQVTVQTGGRVLVHRMEGRQENAMTK